MGKDSEGLEVLLKPALFVGSFICSLPSRFLDGLDAWTEECNEGGSLMEYKYEPRRILSNYQAPPGRILFEKTAMKAFKLSVLAGMSYFVYEVSKYF